MSKVLVISADTIPIKNHLAAGTGIRSWEIARGLRKYGHDIAIAVPKKCHNSDLNEYSRVKIKTWDYDNLISLCDDVDAVFLPQGDAFLSNFFVSHIRNDLCVIVDVYDPNLIESLNMFPPEASGIKGFSDYLMGIVSILKRGDFFVCASNRQRYYYLGVLNVLGRINPLTYNEKMIEIVPFGVPDEDPAYVDRNNVMRGSIVNNDDLVVLWFGGIYPWFDAITLIKAIEIAVKKNPKIKLVIMGAVHPRGHAPPDNYIKTLELSKQLDLYNKNVFFTEWRPYDERIYWYREADIGICTFPLHLETELSNRTRVVDMLWGRLPVITTEGDEMSTLIKHFNCGETVIPNDPEKLAQIIIGVLGDNEKRKMMAENTKRFAENFRWNKVVKPLAEFLNNPIISRDRRDKLTSETLLWYIDTLERHRAFIPNEKLKLDQEIQKKDHQINNLNQQVNQLNQQINHLNEKLDDINSSFTWQLLMKFNWMIERLFPPGTRRHSYYNLLIIGLRTITNKGLKFFIQNFSASKRLFDRFEAKDDIILIKKDEIKNFNQKPKISIIVPVYNTQERWLRKALDSVIEQIYENWELCIVDDGSTKKHIKETLDSYSIRDGRIKVKYLDKNKGISGASNEAIGLATGEYLTFLDHDDEITRDALYEIVRLLNEHQDAEIIYSDDDKIDENGNRYDFQFKPDWSPELFLSYCYISHIKVLKRKLIEEIGGFREGYEGSQDYDLFLRAVEKTDKIYHIPKILYHWRSIPGSVAYSADEKPKSIEIGRKAVEDAIERRGISGQVIVPEFAERNKLGIYKINFQIINRPLISIIIPTKDRVDLLKKCINSIENKTTYGNYEIIIVDSGSKEKETLDYLKETKHKVISIHLEIFNFSKINNYAVSKVDSEFVLLLNNDTEVISDNWLEEMVGYMLSDPKIGAVGAKLIYKDKRVQHAGVVLGLNNGLAGHANKLIQDKDGGYLNYGLVARNYSAVTAACLLTRKKYFEEVGGLDETNLGIAYNDVDFCLKLIQKGYRIIFNPYALLYHDEGGSRGTGKGNDNPAEEEFFKKKWGFLIEKGDPYYNPNLSLEDERFKIRKNGFKNSINFPQSKNLLFISYNLNLEGAPFSQFFLARGLKNRGNKITVVSLSDGPMKNHYLDIGVEVNILRRPITNKSTKEAFISWVKANRFGLAYINTILMYPFVNIKSNIDIPIVWAIRESEKDYYFSTNKSLILKAFQNADRVVFTANATSKIYSEFEYNGNFHTIYNGIELEEIESFKKLNNKLDLRNKHGFFGNSKIITVVGTTCERKGQKIFVKAALKLLSDLSNEEIHFLIVGAREGMYLEQLRNMIIKSKSSTNIHLIPETREVFDYYHISDIFVCTSFIESFPRVILEAMAFELPIISTNVFGIPEEIDDGKSGILIEPGNSDLLAEKMKFLIENDAISSEYSKNAYKRVKDEFSMDNMVSAYQKLFESLSKNI